MIRVSQRIQFLLHFYFQSFNGHVARTRLGIIDHNHHVGRQQARTKAGKTRFTKRFSKRTKTWNVVFVKENKGYSYMPYLCAVVLRYRKTDKSLLQSPVPLRPNDPTKIAPNIATLPTQTTDELKNNYASRF